MDTKVYYSETFNFNPKDAFRNYFPPWNALPDIKLTSDVINELTVGPAGELTYTCHQTSTGPYLSFDSITWDNYFALDIKAGSFITGMAQKVITKILNNNQQKLKITLYSDLDSDWDEEIEKKVIVKIFNYFNQIEDTSKMICLEYKLKCGINQDVYLEGIRNLKTNIFSDIEIWKCTNPNVNTEYCEHTWEVCKWEE